jgi:hypothetical protein
VTVSDGSLTASDSFVLTVNAVNDAPTISNIVNQTTTSGVAVGPLSFTVGDGKQPPAACGQRFGQPDAAPNGNIVFGGAPVGR